MLSRNKREGRFITFKKGKAIRRLWLNNEDLADLIRVTSDFVDKGGVATIEDDVKVLRKYVIPGIHVNKGDQMDESNKGFRMQLEWFGGQLLSMVDEKQWFGINSWINCTDKFTTRKSAAIMESGLA